MPRYVIFMITPIRSETGTSDGNGDGSSDPLLEKMIQEALRWIGDELKAERIKHAQTLAKSSEETSIRIDFHAPDTSTGADPEKNDGGPTIPAPKSSVTRGHNVDVSDKIQNYYSGDFPSTDAVIAWAQSCPISYEGFALEIRQLLDTQASIDTAPTEVIVWAGDQILAARKKLIEQGRMRKDADGTLWGKIEDDQATKDLVAQAEKREAEAAG